MFQSIFSFIKHHVLLFVVLSIGLILIGFFHEILKPFVIAIIVAYIIDPLVKRMNKLKIRNHHIPRGVAVIVAYLLFLTALTGIGFAFIPSLTNEISQATADIPNYFTKVKDEDIPRWSDNINSLLYKITFTPQNNADSQNNKSSEGNKSLQPDNKEDDDLTAPSVDTSGKKPLLIHGERPPSTKELIAAAQDADNDEPQAIFRFKETTKGSYDILPGDSEIVFQPAEHGGYILKIHEDKDELTNAGSFNLEKELSKAAMEFVESSTKYAGSALSILQYTISFIIDTFVQLILVFMLAAFISIDSPKIMAGIRKLFENKDGEAIVYDDFKNRMLKGLSGVVQGQLIICCINGTLTGVGLYFLGVDYSLLLGIIAGLFSIVPIFGTIISTIPAVLLGLVQGPLTALLVLGWILLVHFCDTNFFTPKIVGSSSNLHPVIIIFALLAGQYCAGVLGLILAVPVTSIVFTTINFILEYAQKPDEQETSIPLANIQIAQSSVVLPAVGATLTAYESLNASQDTAILAPEIDPMTETLSSEISPEIIADPPKTDKS